MQVVLLVNLTFDLALNSQAHDIGVSLASNSRGIGVDHRQSLFKGCYSLPCAFLFFLNVVLEVARQRFDLLDLLGQVRAKTAELVDDVCFDIAGLVGLRNSLFVEVTEEAVRLVQAAVAEQGSWCVGIVDDIRHFEQRLGAMLVGRRDFSEVGDEVLQKLTPGCSGVN